MAGPSVVSGLRWRWAALLVATALALAGLTVVTPQSATAATCPCTIFAATDTPARTDADTDPVELGVKVRPATDGFVTAIRYYKPSVSTGTHVGSLWSSTGTRLAQVTFTNETASGWQEATLATPVAVTAGTTYVASYFTPSRYVVTPDFFGTDTVSGPLTAPSSASAVGNGVYRYTSTAGAFPNQTYNASNYWVDVVFTDQDNVKPTVTSRTPAPGASGVGVGSSVSAVFSEAVQQSTIGFELRGPGGTPVAATTTYDAATRTARLTPNAALATATTYTATLSGARDTAGNQMDPVTWTFTTAASANPCPCTLFPATATPDRTDADPGSVELGMKFRSATSGFITGIRYYRPAETSGTHVGSLWSSTGTRLGSATFTNETGSGWQEATFGSPVPVTAGTTYVASYFTPSRYVVSSSYFTGDVVRGPLTAPSSGSSGGNGVYRYTGTAGAFPNLTFNSANYWVDVVFAESATDTKAPTVVSHSPGADEAGVATSVHPTATFSEAVVASSVSMVLRNAANQVVASTTAYDAATATVTLTPSAALATSARYSVTVSGATDGSGNVMAPVTWSFDTAALPPPPPDQGPGGPIAVVTSTASPSSSYLAEIVRAEGFNEFTTVRNTDLTASALAAYSVVVLGDVAITDAQVTALTDWVNAGGNLIAMRPDSRLLGLAGLTAATGTVSEGYLAVDQASEPGAGITPETMQFHGIANRYTLSGATRVAQLYTTPTAATGQPAVSLRSVGTNGGQVAVFAYDLARSVIQTRQGNPAWAGQERDGQAPIRSDDQYFGGAATDWVNLAKVQIPQADEQQRLLANLVTVTNRDRMPVPRFWYLPRGLKAVIVATGDDHATGGTAGRFNTYASASPSGCSVAMWECARFSSYVYAGSPLSDAQAEAFNAQGFEVGLHPQNNCSNYPSQASLATIYANQLTSWRAQYPAVPSPVSGRFHCLVWSDWASQPKVEGANGIRLDVNYYYWPGSWLANRPGFMTGGGFPMRLTETDGTMVDVYQSATVMTDESGQSYPFTPNTLLDRALGPEGYYGAFTANVHTDQASTFEDTQLLASAQQRQVPLISARQLLAWTDGRNASSFSGLSWSGSTLSFTVAVGSGANGLTAMLPTSGPGGRTLSTITRGGSSVAFTRMTVKGQEYAVLPAVAGAHQATYTTGGGAASTVDAARAAVTQDTATLSWLSSEPAATTVRIGSSPDRLTRTVTVAERTGRHRLDVAGLRPGQRYYYRVVSRDTSGEVTVWPAAGRPPLSFRTAAADRSAPRISGIRAVSLPDGTARVTWTTSERATSRVEFGSSRGRLTQARVDDRLTRRHTVVLTELRPRATYRLRVRSADRAGNASRAGEPLRLRTVGRGVALQTSQEFRTGATTGRLVVDPAGLGALTLAGPGRGAYRSRVLDAGQKVHWLRAVTDVSVPGGSRLAVTIRSGSTPTPDRTWSSWTSAVRSGVPLGRAGRYLQYRVQLSATGTLPSVRALGFTHDGVVLEQGETR